MTERTTIGQILTSLGRISEDDVAQALEHQRDQGGYFGEALLACGFVSQEELEWGLASQFDLPYVYPDADSIDMEAASMVSPEWALAHLTLPIMKTEDSLTVVVESPIRTAAVEELHARTELRIDLALASAANIRDVIRQVYARGTAAEEDDHPTPVGLSEAFGEALDAASGRFGISTRGNRTWVWWDDSGTIRRRPLAGSWESEMEKFLDPAPATHIDGETTRAQWDAQLNREGVVQPVEVRYIADESGHEFLFRPVQESTRLRDRFPPPADGVLSEVRMLARSGSARFVVTTDPNELGHEILPHLPPLLLDPSWRSIYVNAQDTDAAEEAFSLKMPTDPDHWAEELETLRAFHFDVVTVDLTGNQSDWAGTALDVASVAFLLWSKDEDLRPAFEAGIRWELHIARAEGDRLEWSLNPLHT